ncbi:putative WD40/YVTN repeat-like domain protein, partial [Trachipleistophora hominis]
VIVNFVVVQYLAVHDLGIEKIEISDDGKYVVAVSRDKSVSFYRILDTSTDSPAGKDSTHNNGNNTTRFNESDAENVINKILNDSPYYLSLRKRIFSHSRRVNAASFDNLGTMFATGSKDRNVLIYSVDSLDVIETIKCEEEVTALRFHDRHLFVGLKNGMLKILKTEGYNQIYEQRIHAKSINEIKFNNNRLITISDDNMMRVFNINKV